MITKKQYLEACKIVEEYKAQQRKYPTNYRKGFRQMLNSLNVSEANIRSRCRIRELVDARKVIAFKMQQTYPGLTLHKLGSLLNRDHSTIVFYQNTIEDQLEYQPEIQHLCSQL